MACSMGPCCAQSPHHTPLITSTGMCLVKVDSSSRCAPVTVACASALRQLPALAASVAR